MPLSCSACQLVRVHRSLAALPLAPLRAVPGSLVAILVASALPNASARWQWHQLHQLHVVPGGTSDPRSGATIRARLQQQPQAPIDGADGVEDLQEWQQRQPSPLSSGDWPIVESRGEEQWQQQPLRLESGAGGYTGNAFLESLGARSGGSTGFPPASGDAPWQVLEDAPVVIGSGDVLFDSAAGVASLPNQVAPDPRPQSGRVAASSVSGSDAFIQVTRGSFPQASQDAARGGGSTDVNFVDADGLVSQPFTQAAVGRGASGQRIPDVPHASMQPGETAAMNAEDQDFVEHAVNGLNPDYQAQVHMNRQLGDQETKLQEQVKQLSTQLERVRHDTQVRRDERATLSSDIAVLRQKVKWKKDLEKEGSQLAQANANLQEYEEQTRKIKQQLRKQLEAADTKIQRIKNTTEPLHKAVIRQYQYNKICQQNISKLMQELRDMEKEHAFEKRRAQETEQVMGFMAEKNKQLKERLAQTREKVQVLQMQAKNKSAALEHEQVQSAQKLTHAEAVYRKWLDTEESLEAEVKLRTDDAKQAAEKVSKAQGERDDLRARIAENDVERLQANNTWLYQRIQETRAAIYSASTSLNQSRENITRWQSASRDLETELHTVMKSEERVENATRNGVAAAKKKTLESQALLYTATMRVQTAANSPEDCVKIWDEKNPEVLPRIKECETMDEDLGIAKAEIAALHGSIVPNKGSAETKTFENNGDKVPDAVASEAVAAAEDAESMASDAMDAIEGTM